jgi:streptogramin lyase
VVGQNGDIYAVPLHESVILVYSPATDQLRTLSIPGAAGINKWSGGIYAPNNGCIYCIPHSATDVLKIDPSTDTVTRFGSLPSTVFKHRGGVVAPSGMIYSISRVAGGIERFLKINPYDDTASYFGGVPSIASGVGGTLAPNGKIYFAPSSGNLVHVLNPADDSYETIAIASGSGSFALVLGLDGYLYGWPWTTGGTFFRVDPDTHAIDRSGTVTILGNQFTLASDGYLYRTAIKKIGRAHV